MNLKIPRLGLALLAAAVIFSIGLTLYLLPRFGGPGISFSSPYQVRATIPDAQSLEVNAVVLDRGVQVGVVKSVSSAGSEASVTLDIDGAYSPIFRDASVRVGQRTAVGDAYVDVVRGSSAAGALASGASIPHVDANVNFDQAFSTFAQPALGHATSLTKTFGRGAASANTANSWAATVHQLSRVVQQTSGLARTLSDQQVALAQLVSGAGTTVRELGSRQRALTSLVVGGQKTLGVIAAQPANFAAGLHRLPVLLATARQTLADSKPLLREAQPLVADLHAAAPQLQAASRDLPPTATSARRILARLPRFNHTALPFLKQATPVVDSARPFARALLPALENLAPAIAFLAPRAPDFAAWFTKTLSGGLQHDSKGPWVRFLIFTDPQTALGIQRGAAYRNPYPAPGGAANPQPYTSGSYPRLLPFKP